MVRTIELTQGKVALIDDEDWDSVSQYKWYAQRSKRKNVPDCFYAARSVRVERNGKIIRSTQQMHKFIFRTESDVDHWDQDSLNNQRDNLRSATETENQANKRLCKDGLTSRYRGVSWYKIGGYWRAQISYRRQKIYLGWFENEVDAAIAFDQAATKYFGEFAVLNFHR